MFDPRNGKWLSEDPIAFQAGDSNLYRYVGNSPTNATDPDGLFELPFGWSRSGDATFYPGGPPFAGTLGNLRLPLHRHPNVNAEIEEGRKKGFVCIQVKSPKDIIDAIGVDKIFKYVVHTIASGGAIEIKVGGRGRVVDEDTIIIDGITIHYRGTTKHRDLHALPAFEKCGFTNIRICYDLTKR